MLLIAFVGYILLAALGLAGLFIKKALPRAVVFAATVVAVAASGCMMVLLLEQFNILLAVLSLVPMFTVPVWGLRGVRLKEYDTVCRVLMLMTSLSSAVIAFG